MTRPSDRPPLQSGAYLVPLLVLAVLALPAAAHAAVGAAVASGVLTITLDAADDATVACVGGATKVNGADPTPAAACTAITRVVVTATGTFANAVDLSGVTNALGFTSVLEEAGGIGFDPGMLSGFGIVVALGAGDDDYLGSNDGFIVEVIEGESGSDTIAPGVGSAKLLFDAAGTETDTLLVTGAGTELRFGGSAPVTVDLNGGVGGDPDAIASQQDRVVKLDPASTLPPTILVGGDGDDTIVGHATVGTVFYAGAGNDTFTGGANDDSYLFGHAPGQPTTVTIIDTAGDNRLSFDRFPSNDPVIVDLTNGLGGGVFARNQSSTIVLSGAPATWASFTRIFGTDGNDDVTGNAKNNDFVDCAGTDVYRGAGGNDVFDEKISFLTAGGNFVDCGNDRYEGGDGDDDYFLACRQTASLETKTLVELPDEGSDRIFHPRTTCVAGSTATYDLRSDAELVRVGPSGGPARQLVVSGAPGQAANFENVFAGSNADTVTGNDGDNDLSGGGTNTLIAGGPGNDTFGSAGTVTYAAAPGPVHVNLASGVATGEGTDDVSAVTRIIGSPFGDTIIGRSGSIVISGGLGDDILVGSFQNVVHGDAGNDRITLAGGGTANGGADDDTLIALAFASTLNGDAGNDTFILSGGLHTVNGGTGTDTVDGRNERTDTIDCGPDADVVLSDQDDTVNGTCETVNQGGTGGAPDTTDLALVSCGIGEPTFAAASADASRVFVTTTEALVPADPDTALDVYELTTAGLRLVSGGSANKNVEFNRISADGTRVFFGTDEALPGTGDTDSGFDVYERADGVLRLVSGGTSNSGSFFGGATADGARVWFTSSDPLVPADTDTASDLYERQGSTLTLLSGPDAALFTITSFGGATADGATVWFTTSKGLLPEDTDGFLDVYQRSGGTLTRISGNGFGFSTGFSGASADGTHVYFISDKSLMTTAVTTGGPRAIGAVRFRLYERSPDGLADLGPNAGFVGVSADGGRVVISTEEALLPGDTDDASDLYRLENGTPTLLLSGGSADEPVVFSAISADATRVVFATAEALLPADTDITTDVYQHDGATLTLLTPGTDDVPAVFKQAADDATRILFRTAEALVPEDTDTGIDVYEWSGGTIALVGAGTGNLTTYFGGSAQAGDVVFVLSDEALLPADADAALDLYAIGPSGFPPAPVCTANLPDEDCDNCLDDDGDTAIDRSDPDCPPPADGAGAALPDPKTLGKAALKCQKALGKAGTKLAASKLKRLQACAQGAFTCLQLKPGDDACLAKAGTKCGKGLAGVAADRAKLGAAVTKACGPPALESADLLGASGLGFDFEEALCGDRGVATLASVADVAACVAATHECRAAELFAVETPRAGELLALLGRASASDAPCLGASADGGGQSLADPTARKAVVKCQKSFAKAGTGFAAQEQKLLQKCAAIVATCLQQKASDPACLAKATTTCGKLAQKLAAAEAKVGTAIAKSCGGAVGVAGVVSSAGLGFGVHETTCAGLGVATLASLADVATCSVRLHACRAEQLLENQTPRLRELLDLGATPLD